MRTPAPPVADRRRHVSPQLAAYEEIERRIRDAEEALRALEAEW